MILEHDLLIRAVKMSVAGIPFTMNDTPNWDLLISAAKKHKLEALLFDGLNKCQIELPPDVNKRLSNDYMQVIFWDTQQEYIKAQLQQALIQAGVPHVFLKGACLKYSYPIPATRTMADMDILVHIDDYAVIDEVCARLGGRLEAGDGNHRNFYFPGGVKVEFHPNIVHQGSPVGTEINPGWQYVKEESPSCSKELTEEGFYLSILCHMVDHFVDGGFGIRFVLDVWVFRHFRKEPIDRAFVERELISFGLLEFAQKIEQLSEVWFGDGEFDPVIDELSEYIITSGVHGNGDRAMLNAISLSKGGTKASAFWSRVFYPRQELEGRYPWAKGKPWLLPIAWFARVFRAITTHGKEILAWNRGTSNFTDSQIAQQREKMKRFGIHRGK